MIFIYIPQISFIFTLHNFNKNLFIVYKTKNFILTNVLKILYVTKRENFLNFQHKKLTSCNLFNAGDVNIRYKYSICDLDFLSFYFKNNHLFCFSKQNYLIYIFLILMIFQLVIYNNMKSQI